MAWQILVPAERIQSARRGEHHRSARIQTDEVRTEKRKNTRDGEILSLVSNRYYRHFLMGWQLHISNDLSLHCELC